MNYLELVVCAVSQKYWVFWGFPGSPEFTVALWGASVYSLETTDLESLPVFFKQQAFSVVLEKFSSVTQSCLTFHDPMDCSTPGLPVHHQLPEFTQIHAHWVGDAIQPSHPLSSPSPPAFKLAQHQGLFKWVSSLHQVAKVLVLQLQHQSFQRIFRTDFL